jgi:NADP-dependent alcohol dehydrogenase
MKFKLLNRTSIEFGKGKISTINRYIMPDDSVLLMYGGGSIKNNFIYDQVIDAIKDYNVIEFSGVESNPTYENLSKAVDIVRDNKITYILAVGGGSVVDGAKYVAAASCYDGDGWDIMIGSHIISKAIPLGVVITLPATGSESNDGAVITKANTKTKLPIHSEYIVPSFAILDPDVVKSLPNKQLINGIVDAFIHVTEHYLTKDEDMWVQDGYSEVLLRNLLRLGQTLSEENDDIWRQNLMWTANQAMYGLTRNGVQPDWSTHLLGHEITAIYGIDHAVSLSIIHASLLRFKQKEKYQKLEMMGRNVFGFRQEKDIVVKTINAIEDFYRLVGIPISFREAGFTDKTIIDELVRSLEKHGLTLIGENKDITLKDSRDIYTKSF